ISASEAIKVLHNNESNNERRAHKARHESFGCSHIGFDALSYIVNHSEFKDIPKNLETPFVGPDKKNRNAPSKYEVDMIKSGTFDPNLLYKINPALNELS